MKLGDYEVKLEKKLSVSGWEAMAISTLAILIALGLFGFIFLQAGVNPLLGYKEIFSFAFTTSYGAALTISSAVFILLCTCAFIVPMKAGLWNIGMAGQLYVGALGAFAVAFAFGAKNAQRFDASPFLVIPLMILGAMASGALIGAIPGFLKGRFNTNEIVVTMMLNSIAYWVVAYMIKEGGPFMGGGGEGEGFKLPSSIYSPQIGTTGVPYTIFVALGLAAFLYFMFARTKLGYEIKTFGMSPDGAKYAGIDPRRISLLVFMIGGLIAGFAGYHYFTAVKGVYKITMNYGNYGDLSFYGIICGLISQENPIAAIPIALLFGGLINGGRNVQGKLNIGYGMDYALLGILMITLVFFQFFYRYKIVLKKTRKEK